MVQKDSRTNVSNHWLCIYFKEDFFFFVNFYYNYWKCTMQMRPMNNYWLITVMMTICGTWIKFQCYFLLDDYNGALIRMAANMQIISSPRLMITINDFCKVKHSLQSNLKSWQVKMNKVLITWLLYTKN